MTCKDCIHENLCVIKAFPSAFENTHWEKEPCDHFASMSGWISVEEALPEPKKLVLCIWNRTENHSSYGFARYQHDDVWYVSNEGMPRVTHWMPLPELPQMKGGESDA